MTTARTCSGGIFFGFEPSKFFWIFPVNHVQLSSAGVPPAVHVRPSPGHDEVRVTTLSNGMKVASVPKFGLFCSVGVGVDSRSRYEVAYPSGVAHFVEKMALGATEKFESRDDILQR